MIGQIIQSYLVSLGVQIDKPGFQQADATINKTTETIQRATGSWATNFLKASAVISTALASVTASAVGLMKATANQDLQMRKYARNMMISEQQAWKLKKATDALGESMNDIALDPELLGRFKQLTADGSQMMIGGDFKETMKDFRDLIFEFQRLKQEASYAMNWVGYYLMKYLQKPLADIRAKFKAFNDSVVKNMSVWTEKVARAIYYVINVGKHLIDFLQDVGKHLYDIWDSFPKGVKIAAAALTALSIVMRATPAGRMIMLLTTLLLLIDDYYGYMEGKEAAFGEYWDKLNKVIDGINNSGVLETFTGYLKEAFDILWDVGQYISQHLIKAAKDLDEWLEKTGIYEAFNKVIEKTGELIKILWEGLKTTGKFLSEVFTELEKRPVVVELNDSVAELVKTILDCITTIEELIEMALKPFFEWLGKRDTVILFTNALEILIRMVKDYVKFQTDGYKILKDFLDLIKKASSEKGFENFMNGMNRAMEKTLPTLGKIAKTCALLMGGEWKKASDLWSGGSDEGGSNAGSGDTDWNKRVVYERFKAAGYSDEAIAGIMGRVQQEHGFNTSEVPEHWATDANGRQIWVGGLGMFQWNGDRTIAMKNWAAENGLDYLDPGAQADYAIIEAKQRGLTPERMNKMTVSEAATAWTDEWEVGEHGYEQSYASGFYNDMQNGAPWMYAQPKTAPNGKNLGGGYAGDMSNASKELQHRFAEAVTAMREKGYSFYIQSSTENSIGFTTPSNDYENIEDVLRSHGLEVSRDSHGFYVSLPENAEDTTSNTAFGNGGGGGDYKTFGDKVRDANGGGHGVKEPFQRAWERAKDWWNNVPQPNMDIVQPMMAGYAGYNTMNAGGYNSVVNIEVGGITVNGAGKTGVEIGNSVVDAFSDRLKRATKYQSNNLLTSPMNVGFPGKPVNV